MHETLPLEIAKYSAATFAKSIVDGEVQLLGTAIYMVTAKSVLAELLGELHEEARLSWPRASGTSSVVGSTVAKLVDEVRLIESQRKFGK